LTVFDNNTVDPCRTESDNDNYIKGGNMYIDRKYDNHLVEFP